MWMICSLKQHLRAIKSFGEKGVYRGPNIKVVLGGINGMRKVFLDALTWVPRLLPSITHLLYQGNIRSIFDSYRGDLGNLNHLKFQSTLVPSRVVDEILFSQKYVAICTTLRGLAYTPQYI